MTTRGMYPDTEAPPILQASHISKWFEKPTRFQVLKDISFHIHPGEFLALMGKSGSGKSTLLYVLSTMDTDYEGELRIGDTCLNGQSQQFLSDFRGANIGFVFQFHYLLSSFTVLRNVMLPALKLGRYSPAEIEHRAVEKLKLLGLEDQMHKPANKLSGGQQQRVAIARALINDPLIIMGDEPTGNLDSHNSAIVFDLLRAVSQEMGQSILAVTHDPDFAARCDRIIELEDGYLLSDGTPKKASG
jgi:lipoprotein-releasing system ATP-binding protein